MRMQLPDLKDYRKQNEQQQGRYACITWERISAGDANLQQLARCMAELFPQENAGNGVENGNKM